MTNPQGTAWETDIVRRAQEYNLAAIRLVKQGQKDEADVLIGPRYSEDNLGVVFWKRLVKGKGKNRQPLGERYTATLNLEDFLYLLSLIPDEDLGSVYVQAKWTERLSVTKVLAGLNKWIEKYH